jgi:hypothetical protein
VRPLVAAYYDAVSVRCKLATGFSKLAGELFGLRFVESMQPGSQPPIAAISQDGQSDIDVHGHAIEMKGIDTDTQAVLHTVASSIAEEQFPCTGVEVVGHHQSELGAPSAVPGQLLYRAIVPAECHGLVHRADVLMAAFGAIQPMFKGNRTPP